MKQHLHFTNLICFHYIIVGGTSYHNAAGGTAYGNTNCKDIEYGSGGGGNQGGAGGSYIEINAGTVSYFKTIIMLFVYPTDFKQDLQIIDAKI